MAFALAAAVWAFSSPSATWLAARTRMPAATAPQMCTTEKPEAPTPNGETEGSAHALEALDAVKVDGRALKNVSPELQADREVVLAAVQQNGRALEYASTELKADREVVLAAVQQRGLVLKYASPELRDHVVQQRDHAAA